VTDPSSNFGLALPKPSGDTTSIRVTSREAGTGAALVVTTSSGGGNLPPDAGDATVTPEGVGAIGLSITADTFTNTGVPDNNFGDNSNVRSNSKRVGYYRFDLSSVAPGTLVVSAELELHVQTVNQGGPVDLHGILGGWSELNLTANNTPGFDAVADASLLISSADVDGVVSVDVTALVQQWVANPAANFGLALARPSGSSTSVFFSSRESGLGAVLNISTVPADPVAGSNIAPAIDGAPLATVMAETEYLFTPDATDADGDLLHFSIENRPSWAVFDTQTGTLWGVPGPNNVGTTGNIVISVSDAQASTSLAAFTVTVSPSGQGSVVLNWLPPTENDDGSSLTNLGSYRIYYGTSPEELNSTIDINNPGLTSYVVGNLSPDTYYFAATAISSDGVESDLSAIVVYLVNYR
jgi:hypothetical protein